MLTPENLESIAIIFYVLVIGIVFAGIIRMIFADTFWRIVDNAAHNAGANTRNKVKEYANKAFSAPTLSPEDEQILERLRQEHEEKIQQRNNSTQPPIHKSPEVNTAAQALQGLWKGKLSKKEAINLVIKTGYHPNEYINETTYVTAVVNRVLRTVKDK